MPYAATTGTGVPAVTSFSIATPESCAWIRRSDLSEGGPRRVLGAAAGQVKRAVYCAAILGTWKVLGAIVIAAPGLPRVKEWAYAGFVFDLTAAAVSRAAVGDGAADIIAPLVFL